MEGAQKHYTQTAEEALHLSMAALEPNSGESFFLDFLFHVDQVLMGFLVYSGGTGLVSLMFQQSDGKKYMLCSLEQGKHIQQPLDLNFAQGEKITFFLTGKGKVHLTGFFTPEGKT